MIEPLVDVLLPHYRGTRYLGAALDSLRAQTYGRWRLTVVDDASGDGSLDELRRLVAPDGERAQVLVQSVNRGAAAARMRGARASDGELIALLDQDDVWHPEKLAREVGYLADHPECAAVHADVVIVDPDGTPLEGAADEENARRARVDWHGPLEDVSRRLFQGNCIRIISSLLRRAAFEAAGGFDETLRGGEDWEFWSRFTAHHRVHHLAEPLLLRRVHGENTVTTQRYLRSLGRLEAWRKLVREQPHVRPLAAHRRRQLLREARDAARATGHPLRAGLLELRLGAQRLGLRI